MNQGRELRLVMLVTVFNKYYDERACVTVQFSHSFWYLCERIAVPFLCVIFILCR